MHKCILTPFYTSLNPLPSDLNLGYNAFCFGFRYARLMATPMNWRRLLARLTLGIIALTCFVISALPIGFYGMALYLKPSLPKVDTLQVMSFEMPLQIYTLDQKLIGQYGNRYSLPIAFSELPNTLVQAILSAEDDAFFSHTGVSVRGIGRALTQAAMDDTHQTGGSTITMQVAKNYFLTPERSLNRKLTELYIARELENHLNKEDILTLYVNKIYMGEGAYGIRAAAKRYYSKELEDLTLAQMAMLAGLPKAPSAYNPVNNPKRALVRRDWILGRMLAAGYIDKTAYDAAINEPINLHLHQETLDADMPYVAEMARGALVELYGANVVNSGYRVVLTLDSQTQQAAQDALSAGLKEYDHRHGWRGVEADEGNLENFVNYASMEAAQVTKVNARSFEAMRKNGETITVDWSGMSWARPYRSADSVGGSPSRASALVKVGNIVRIAQEGDVWRLTQTPAVQGALASLDPRTGAIRGIGGGFDFRHSLFNRATQGLRQPGSIIKPLIYSKALDEGQTPDTVISDAPLSVGAWRPQNADGRYLGAVTMRQAIASSRNLPVIRTLDKVGIDKTRAHIHKMGLPQSNLPKSLVIALGAAEATPLQMATAYATFANGGHRIEPYFIERIYNLNNELLYQATPKHACAKCFNAHREATNEHLREAFLNADTSAFANLDKVNAPLRRALLTKERLAPLTPIVLPEAEQAPRILSPRATYQMADMLKGVITSGTGRRAQAIGRDDVGGKTGTTNLAKDAWFAGIHPTNVAVVWVGFDTPAPLGQREFGGVAALPIWVDYMKIALDGVPQEYVHEGNAADT